MEVLRFIFSSFFGFGWGCGSQCRGGLRLMVGIIKAIRQRKITVHRAGIVRVKSKERETGTLKPRSRRRSGSKRCRDSRRTQNESLYRIPTIRVRNRGGVEALRTRPRRTQHSGPQWRSMRQSEGRTISALRLIRYCPESMELHYGARWSGPWKSSIAYLLKPCGQSG